MAKIGMSMGMNMDGGMVPLPDMRLSPPMANSIEEAIAHQDTRRSSLSEQCLSKLYACLLPESKVIPLAPEAVLSYMHARSHSISSSDISFYRMAYELQRA